MENVHIITGGSSGIGLECAKRFTDGIVVITGRNEKRLAEAVSELENFGIKARACVSDISDLASIKEMFKFTKSLGKLKTIVNSAGVSGGQADAKVTLEIDLLGSQYLIEETYNNIEDDLVLIMISSIMGHVVADDESYNHLLVNPKVDGNIDKLVGIVDNVSDVAYNFAKKGVIKLVNKYAFEFGSKNARIVSLSPGIILTPMAKLAAEDHPEQMNYMKMMTPLQRNGEPEDIADVVAFLASDSARFISGTDILVDGGLLTKISEIRPSED